MARSSINQLNEAYAEEIKAGGRKRPAGRAFKIFVKTQARDIKPTPSIWFDEASALNQKITQRIKWTLSELGRRFEVF